MATTPTISSSTVTPTEKSLFQKSVEIYNRQYPATTSQCAAAAVAVVANIAVGVVILASSLRKKRYFIFSLHLAIADFLVGFAFVFVDIRRINVVLTTKGYVVPVVDCLLDVWPMTLAITASQVFATLVSLDRLIAIGLPIKYGRLGFWYTVAMMGGGWLYSILDATFVYVVMPDPSKKVIICTNLATYSQGYADWSTVSRGVWTALSVVFCLLALYLLRKRFGGGDASKKSSGSDQELKESTKTITIIVAIMVLTQISSRIGYFILNPLPGEEKSKIGMYLRILQISNSAINFFVYVWRSPAFRNAMLRRTQRVQPTG